MLELQVNAVEFYDEANGEFVTIEPQTLHLEHSLYAIAKWESKWKIAFLADDKRHKKTPEQMLDYIRCMILDDNVDPLVLQALTKAQQNEIAEYMNDSMTATWFNDKLLKQGKTPGNNEIVTSELVYYWMAAAQIPFETQYWHFNRLMTLLKVASIKSQPSKKMSKQDVLRQNHMANKARRKPRT